jgi:hypothetical protein
MAALTSNVAVNHKRGREDCVITCTVASNTRIFQGALVGLTSGTARPMVNGDQFAGLAFANGADNRTAAEFPESRVEVLAEGTICGVSITGASSAAQVGWDVFCATDNIADLTTTATSAVKIGKIVHFDPILSKFDVAFIANAFRTPS